MPLGFMDVFESTGYSCISLFQFEFRDSEQNSIRDRIRCFEWREYDHFVRECPTRQESRETEQIQQLFNMDKDQTIIQTPLMDTEEDEMTIIPMESRDNLNL